MELHHKTKEELIIELEALQREFVSLKASIEADFIVHKRTEEELRASEERFQLLFNKAPLGYQSLDFDGNFLEVNQQWLDTLGYERHEVIGKWFGHFLSPAYQDGFRERFPVFKAQGHIHSEFEMVHKNGKLLFIAFDGRIGYDLKGQFKQTHCILQDITERRLIEKKLKESQERYALVMDASEQGIWDWNVETNEVFFSEQWKNQIGYQDHELKNEFNTWVEHLHPDEREYCQNAVFSYLSHPVEHFILEFRFRHKNGSYRLIYNKASSIKNQEGKVVRLFGTHTDITEKRLSESIFQDIIEKNPMSIQVLDMEGYPIQVNQAHTKLFGVEPPASYSLFNDAQLLAQGFGEFLDRIKKGEVVNLPASYYNVHDLDPSFPNVPVWVKAIGFTLNDSSGKPNRIVLMHENITEQIHAEALLNDIIDKNPMSIQIVDKLGHTLQANPAFSKLFGAIPPPNFSIFDDLTSKNPELESLILRVKRGEVVNLPDIYFNAHDAVEEAPDIPLWIRALIFPLNDGTGKPERFVFMHENITERKFAENALLESKERFKLLFEAAPDAIILADAENRKIVEANSAACSLLAKTLDEIVGMYQYELHPVQNKDYSVETFSNHLKDLSDGNRSLPIENFIVRPDGSLVPVEILAQLIYFKGKPVLMGTFRDITERRQVQIELINAKNKAEESDRLKSAFLANMSHEIRTPMNGILGFAELLKEGGLTGEQQQEYIRIISKSGTRMLNIINDIVDISKIEAGLMKTDIRETSINDKIEYIYTFFKPEVDAKGLQLSFETPLVAKEAYIFTDSEKLYAILINLVKNAIKFTEKGRIEIGYKVIEEHGMPQLMFYVKDTGIGVPIDRQVAIFERFIQADIADKMARQGAGLGLSITKAYVEMLGGRIWLESEVNVGSIFYFTLPYNLINNKVPVFNTDVEAEELLKTSKLLKILIAEDDETSDMLISINVNKYCKEILNVRSGVEAVEICRTNPDLDLVLMDIQMPEMNGYEATRQIRQFNTDIIIIAQTAFGLSGDRAKAIEAGCNDYISKPISKAKLEALILKYFQE